jgi:hypothetical protein
LTSEALDAGYNTGFLRTGQDTWKIVVTLPAYHLSVSHNLTDEGR